ncbi:ATP-binding cassette domain-containing protein [Listeria monocytogenes]|uniref:ABC transporter ATP-binding protein n=2 Tax=Listeriaceae TaxID=186820 RepID=UPI000E76F037|nr:MULTISPECIES: ABC transporter ATP-binding protein [Listeria]EDH3594661.1 ATP-binding cassette domain-containing protein [Listeria monocytogenes]MBC1910980.1 ABC transporter ATP-binding protein [Listeria innocua]MBC1926114.1 ABC transporter ATP-binding protein [Listeria innocua]MBC1929062.1 ABC transporter ATP-binding protein [Listeria innocua]RJZ11684.1 putative ABC transporter ATP-binding protein YxlF [Listeria monocytogenes]
MDNTLFSLSVKNVSKVYENHQAVSDFSMKIDSNECIGLIGPNGAGKTTLLKMITGILNPTSGEVLINKRVNIKAKNLIGYLPQYPQFYDWMTGSEVLDFYSSLSGIPRKERKKAIREVLDFVGLRNVEDKKVIEYSGGMKQRLGIAQAVIHKPKFVILDEPVSALDPIGRREVLDLIKKIKADTTILFSTHILNDAEEVCDRFVVMKESKKIEDFYLSDLVLHEQKSLIIETGCKNNAWLEYLNDISGVESIDEKKNGFELKFNTADQKLRNQIVGSLSKYNISFSRIDMGYFSFEDYFMNLVGDLDE